MLILRNFVLHISVIFSSSIYFAQEINNSKLNNYFESLESNNKFMGSVAVSKDGVILYTKSIGYSDVETKAKNTNSSKYRIGSISKTFTAVLVLKAIEEKKLKLSTFLYKYYPTVPNAKNITIENLLYHRSGIHSFTDDEDYLEWNTQFKTEEELVTIISKGSSEFEPDSKFQYSNPNFILLSFILQKIYQKTYAELVSEKITIPLEMTSTYFGNKIDLNNKECYSYYYENGWTKESETDMSIPMGAGGIVSNATDLLKFSEGLFSEKIVSKKSLLLMHTLKDDFGIGIFPLPFQEHKSFGHTGAIDGFSSIFSYFPDSKVAFALVSNGTNYNNNEIAKTLLSELFGKPYEVPSFKKYPVTSEDLKKYFGTYASEDLPLKLTISAEENVLVAQATGQGPLHLDATDKDEFTFDPAGIVLIFDPEKGTILLKQGGGEFLFTKE